MPIPKELTPLLHAPPAATLMPLAVLAEAAAVSREVDLRLVCYIKGRERATWMPRGRLARAGLHVTCTDDSPEAARALLSLLHVELCSSRKRQ